MRPGALPGAGEGDRRPGVPSRAIAGVELFGAMRVIDTDLHDRWCTGWDLTRLAQRPVLAVCPGCACAVRVGPLPPVRKF